jgi:hypothetical protein
LFYIPILLSQLIKENIHASESLNIVEVGDLVRGLTFECDRLWKAHGIIATVLEKDIRTVNSLKQHCRKEINRVEIIGRILDMEKKGASMQIHQNKAYSSLRFVNIHMFRLLSYE